MATSKKLTIINNPSTKLGASDFQYWGNQGETAMGQGWKPIESGDGYTKYRQTYNAPFNDVYLPETPNERGRIEVVGKKGNKMDIVISDKAGNVKKFIHQDVSPEFVRDYFQNNQSLIQQRMNNIKNKKLNAIVMR